MADGCLAGLRVVECGGPVAAPYAAKLLGDLGADVVIVEPAEGSAARHRGPYPHGLEGNADASGLFLYLGMNKRSMVLDPESDADRASFQEMLARADVLIHDLRREDAEPLGINPLALRSAYPRLVHTWITPFGLSGPHAGYEADNLTSVAAGGWASITPGMSERADLPPLKAFGRQADYQSALTAAIGTLGALAGRDKDGRGDFIEVCAQEAIAGILEMGFVQWTYAGRIPSRLGRRTTGPMQMMQAKGGPIFAMAPDENHWRSLTHMMGDPEWASWEVFGDRLKRGENFDALRPLLEEWFANHTPAEIFEMAATWHLPFAPVNSIAELVTIPQLEARRFWVAPEHPVAGAVGMPGAPYLLSDGGWSLRRRAPLLGEHTDEVRADLAAVTSAAAGPPPPIPPGEQRGRPLEGLRVIDFTWAWAGPHCTLQLAALGAEVIRLESYYRPCQNRRIPPYPDDIPGLNRSGSFNQNNQGKRSVVIDLHQPEGTALALDLVATADVLVENYSVGVVARLGLGWDAVVARNPRLIMASLSGWGQTGPYRDRVAYGASLNMFSGMTALTGFDGPTEVGMSYGDPNGGLHGTVAILAALRLREKTGRGQFIDLSQLETLMAVLAEGVLPWTMRDEQLPRMGNRDSLMSPHGIFRAAGNDRWISIAVRNDEEWRRFAEIVDPALAADARFTHAAGRKANEDELEGRVTAWTSLRYGWEATGLLQAAGIPAFPVLDAREVAEDPHMTARHSYNELPHPEVGVRRHVGAAWRSPETPIGVRKAAPCMGEDNEYVVMQLLGRSREEYDRLAELRVVERISDWSEAPARAHGILAPGQLGLNLL
jgi:crotonobetainyl-CoA:carnitine CoA-transferase CaiB-like acyl-CoA transferase